MDEWAVYLSGARAQVMALVVTGAMASRALCAALEHEPAYPAETIDCLMQEAEVDADEAASMFEDVTGKPLRPRTAR